MSADTRRFRQKCARFHFRNKSLTEKRQKIYKNASLSLKNT
nr:MAG TPA: hypothetical protein [Caudoviricetes sp.]